MLRILVVDQEIESCDAISNLARFAGHTAISSHSAASAIEHLRLGRTDLIMLDLDMPKMDGWQLLEWLRTRYTPRELPVIGHSHMVDQRSRRMAYKFGVNECRVKVLYTVENLRAILHPYLDDTSMAIAA